VPETKGLTLEELDKVFGQKTLAAQAIPRIKRIASLIPFSFTGFGRRNANKLSKANASIDLKSLNTEQYPRSRSFHHHSSSKNTTLIDSINTAPTNKNLSHYHSQQQQQQQQHQNRLNIRSGVLGNGYTESPRSRYDIRHSRLGDHLDADADTRRTSRGSRMSASSFRSARSGGSGGNEHSGLESESNNSINNHDTNDDVHDDDENGGNRNVYGLGVVGLGKWK
jgi:hypothetical protein